MPTVHRENGFQYFFFSNEGNPHEPVHIHVRKAGAIAKVWLEPEPALADSDGFTAQELRAILNVIQSNRQSFIEAWHEHFG